MKLLLDENLPRKLKQNVGDHQVQTVREVGWAGKTNGESLNLMLENNFDIFLTFDKNLQHPQNFDKYPISVLVLSAPSNQYVDLKELVFIVKEQLQRLAPGVTIVTAQ